MVMIMFIYDIIIYFLDYSNSCFRIFIEFEN